MIFRCVTHRIIPLGNTLFLQESNFLFCPPVVNTEQVANFLGTHSYSSWGSYYFSICNCYQSSISFFHHSGSYYGLTCCVFLYFSVLNQFIRVPVIVKLGDIIVSKNENWLYYHEKELYSLRYNSFSPILC